VLHHATQRILLCGLLFSLGSIAFAAEPWTDPRLPTTNGLAFWFDVSRQNAARGTAGLAPLQSWNDAPDILLDGSGQRRHLTQPVLNARPRFRQEFNGAMLTFDGVDDFLAVSGRSNSFAEATLLVVAAPRTNGGYRALASFNAAGQNDYTSGVNLDFGFAPAATLARVNAEGAGFNGEFNLLTALQPLGRWHVFTLVAGRGSRGVKLFLDGQPQGARDRAGDSVLRFDDFTLGARRYSNTPDRPHVQGFLGGEFTEVLAFDRALPEAERQAVERYLDAKYGALLHGLVGAPVREGAVPLITVSNTPPVQVFVPGFSARELPVELNNVNNVRYRADGKLVAVGYDGRIWLLSDTNGDELEDKVEPFWDKQTLRAPIGAALTPPAYARGNGVFVAAKDKLALIVDTNGDDRADTEITVATWTERSEQQGVDALGVAVAPDGSIYFSLGTASFTEPYLIDKATGQPRYRTTMERGTIQRVSPDFSKRETVCTGIRFAVGLAFNRNGDLFCTDQEGATWVHNGNPFDELLHIQPGRHYGFPPRHPRHLPNVIDEPSVFDYTPQHQSTCGLCFNEPTPARTMNPLTPSLSPSGGEGGPAVAGPGEGKVFGPPWWAGDAMVAGYSRGKLWRTKLVKTSVGYVAQAQLFATLQMLTVDACVSPRGDLIVATHSGQPDWGSGPNGKGRLWRIRYEERNAPQPTSAWNASPDELKIAFDRPLDPASLKDLTTRAQIESGKYVFAGDRFETIRPGYQVVYDQLAAPRYAHEVLSAQLSPDRRTLTLVTRPRATAVNYAVTLPSVATNTTRAQGSAEGHYDQIDLLTDLAGVEARWESADGKETWSGWLPHVDLRVARELTQHSAEHERFFALLNKPGTFTLRGQIDLWQMLQPAVQPGSTIDWERPPEGVTVRFESDTELAASFGARSVHSAKTAGDLYRAEQVLRGPGQRWQSFELKLTTGGRELTLVPSWSTADDPRPRAFPLRRFLLPWAQPADSSTVPETPIERAIPEIAGGNWLHGGRLFFGDKLGCAKCHTIRGEGGHAGPDLSNLIHRDYASVLKDIQLPNAAINPDHVASVVELTDGESITGIVQREADGVLYVALAGGLSEQLSRSKVRSVRPAQLSLMPEGLWVAMTLDEQRDLMTFLLSVPLEPHPAALEAQGQKLPPARKRNEFESVLLVDAAPPDTNHSLLHVVLCASPKDPGHGAPGFHDYPLWRERWSKLLSLADNVSVETAERWPGARQWQHADLIVFYHDNPEWSVDKARDIDAFLARGGGLVFLHWSMNAYHDAGELTRRLGRAWGAGAKFRYGIEQLSFRPHEVTRGFPPEPGFTDEAYWNLPGDDAGVTIIATSNEEGTPQPQVWLKEQGTGRIFVCIPGHFTWTLDDPLYRLLVFRGMCWSARQPLHRFNELATIGARLAD
jgi:putative heme-binding domain-containing protein